MLISSFSGLTFELYHPLEFKKAYFGSCQLNRIPHLFVIDVYVALGGSEVGATTIHERKTPRLSTRGSYASSRRLGCGCVLELVADRGANDVTVDCSFLADANGRCSWCKSVED